MRPLEPYPGKRVFRSLPIPTWTRTPPVCPARPAKQRCTPIPWKSSGSSVQYSSAPRRDRGGTQDCLWTRPVGRRALSLERWTRRGSTRVLSQCRQAFLSVVIRMYNLLNTTLSVTMFYNWHNSLENKKCKFWSHPLALGIHYITQSRTEQQAEQTALSCNVLFEQR